MTTPGWLQPDTGEVTCYPWCGGMVTHFSRKSPTRESADSEDAACLVEAAGDLGLLAVADGVGGAARGDRAARAGIERLLACCGVPEYEAGDPRGLRAGILDAIELANREILEWGLGAASTLTAVEYHAGLIRSFHVGDSDALLISNRGKIKFATVGHGPVAQAMEMGLLNESEAMGHVDRNLITNCLGSTEMKIEIGPTIKMATRDTLLVASDGLFDNLTSEEITSVIRCGNLEARTNELALRALQRMNTSENAVLPCKPDDLTILCFRQVR